MAKTNTVTEWRSGYAINKTGLSKISMNMKNSLEEWGAKVGEFALVDCLGVGGGCLVILPFEIKAETTEVWSVDGVEQYEIIWDHWTEEKRS